MSHERTSFITLTYDKRHIPPDLQISRRELQLFYKRLRKEVSPRLVKYFGCGEYGGKLGRPHYHSIVFGEDEQTLDFKRTGYRDNGFVGKLASWDRGEVHIVPGVNYKMARYVANYMHKDTRKEVYGGRMPPFGLKSNGLGKRYCLENAERLRRNFTDHLEHVPVGLPRIYREWLGIKEEYRLYAERHHDEHMRESIKRYGHDPERIRRERVRHIIQHDKNLLGIENMGRSRRGEVPLVEVFEDE